MRINYSDEGNRKHSPSDRPLHEWYVDAINSKLMFFRLQPGDGTSYDFVACNHMRDWTLIRLHSLPELRVIMTDLHEQFDINPHTIAIMRDMFGRLQHGGGGGTHYSWTRNQALEG